MTPEAIFILTLFVGVWLAGYIAITRSVSWENIPPRKKPIAAAVLLFLWPWLAIEIARKLP